MATSRRNSTEPITAPVIVSPSVRAPTSASPIITLARPHTTMPIPICTSANPWYCARNAPDKRNEAVRDRQAENDHLSSLTPEGANHLGIVARGAHRGSQVGAEKPVEQQAHQNDRQEDQNQGGGVEHRDVPSEDVQRLLAAPKLCPHVLGVGGQRRGRKQGNVAAAHDVKVDGVQSGHHQDACQQAVDFELGGQNAGQRNPPRIPRQIRRWRP